jgi:cobalt-zinc-cadmium efflux system outer membrane protein
MRSATLTLDQCLAIAEEKNPRLRAGMARIDAARAGITVARAYPNPQASAQAGGQTFRVPGNVSGSVQFFQFSQPLELGSLRPTRIALARRGQEVRSLEFDSVRLAVLSAVRRAFYEALRAQGEIEILEENLRTVEDFRDRIQVRVEVGEAGRIEIYRADAELATARSAVISARQRYAAALARLRAAIGAPLESPITLAGELDPPKILPPLQQIRQEIVERHPLLAAARSEVRRAEARISYENAQRFPQPSVFTEIERVPDTPIYRVGISIPFPLWNLREGQIAEAVAEARAASADAESQREQLLAAVEGAYHRYQLASQLVEAFQQGQLRAGEEGLRAAEVAYRLGERGILEVLDAQRVLRTVRLDYLNAQFDRQAALVDLDEARAIDPRKDQ